MNHHPLQTEAFLIGPYSLALVALIYEHKSKYLEDMVMDLTPYPFSKTVVGSYLEPMTSTVIGF